ncbi:hypothetical protein [Halalkalibacillus halophilus]|uniref:hypothetical protein n=1 Tax=Halalkalibacillus halophilus TaxID=392827 RepID=UPI000411160C|nr:hypothetical protein [Halalkalibacillus halophilus]
MNSNFDGKKIVFFIIIIVIIMAFITYGIFTFMDQNDYIDETISSQSILFLTQL